MQIKPLRLAGAYEIQLTPHHDTRGYFVETYRASVFRDYGLVSHWLQENQSLSQTRGVLRGLHFQLPPHQETKLIRVLQGRIFDVFVDLRRDSPSYGQWDSVMLDGATQNMVYIPRGFAHGFCTLAEDCLVAYKVDSYYHPPAQAGLRWDDPQIAIEWPVSDPLLSEKDQTLPLLAEFESPFRMSMQDSPEH